MSKDPPIPVLKTSRGTRDLRRDHSNLNTRDFACALQYSIIPAATNASCIWVLIDVVCFLSVLSSPPHRPPFSTSVAVIPVSPAIVTLLDGLGAMLHIYTGSVRQRVRSRQGEAATCEGFVFALTRRSLLLVTLLNSMFEVANGKHGALRIDDRSNTAVVPQVLQQMTDKASLVVLAVTSRSCEIREPE